ncbi:MAG: hypothetical protein H6658_15265 [Ardenticatenaceae bacterium]|nr:hypothetical protein [Ardenticatenaceae bacterium]
MTTIILADGNVDNGNSPVTHKATATTTTAVPPLQSHPSLCPRSQHVQLLMMSIQVG